MLNKLYKKLHLLFTLTLMLIITFIIVMMALQTISVERQNEEVQLQRTATLLIYQLEAASSPDALTPLLHTYETDYQLLTLLQNEKGNTLYQSASLKDPTNTTLLDHVQTQVSTKPLHHTHTSSQSGIIKTQDKNGHRYYAVCANINTPTNTFYTCTFLSQSKNSFQILKHWIPIYILIWGFCGVIITLLTRLLLKRAFQPTEDTLKSQKDFIAAASHELKTPLAVIIANTDTLANHPSLNASAQKIVHHIDSECMRLNQLIKDMLLLATSDAKTWKSHPQHINIDTFLITLYELYEPVCHKNHITLQLQLPEDNTPSLFTDQERLMQLLSILIDNAIAHATPTPSIEIVSTQTNKNLSISIIDHGPGIKNSEKPLIFNRFYSGDSSRTSKAHFGLGLSIAFELSQLLEATLKISNTAGGGATFTVDIPFKIKQ